MTNSETAASPTSQLWTALTGSLDSMTPSDLAAFRQASRQATEDAKDVGYPEFSRQWFRAFAKVYLAISSDY